MSPRHPQTAELTRDQDLQLIREALRGLRYGSVNVVVQDGLVIQIDRTEKTRKRSTSALKREAEHC
jgi:hypothetical protein